jgi:hypothetical protein
MKDEKYVMCKGFYGLGGNLAVLVCALRLSKKLNRKLIVDWEGSNFSLSNGDIFKELFEEPIDIAPPRVEWGGLKVFPEYWQDFIKYPKPYSSEYPLTRATVDMAEELDENELKEIDIIVVSRDDKYWHKADYFDEISALMKLVVPMGFIRDRVERFENEFLKNNSIGVHFRHGNGENSVVPPDINWFYSAIDEFLGKFGDASIFLCTDCSAVEDVFRNRYGDKVVVWEKIFPILGSGTMQFVEGDENRLNSAVGAIMDMWTLSKCTCFVGSRSFFSGVAGRLNKGLDKDHSRWWVPKYRSHSKKENQQYVSEIPVVEKYFNEENVLTDGILLEETTDGSYDVIYLYENVGHIDDLTNFNIEPIRERIKCHRLY